MRLLPPMLTIGKVSDASLLNLWPKPSSVRSSKLYVTDCADALAAPMKTTAIAARRRTGCIVSLHGNARLLWRNATCFLTARPRRSLHCAYGNLLLEHCKKIYAKIRSET